MGLLNSKTASENGPRTPDTDLYDFDATSFAMIKCIFVFSFLLFFLRKRVFISCPLNTSIPSRHFCVGPNHILSYDDSFVNQKQKWKRKEKVRILSFEICIYIYIYICGSKFWNMCSISITNFFLSGSLFLKYAHLALLVFSVWIKGEWPLSSSIHKS